MIRSIFLFPLLVVLVVTLSGTSQSHAATPWYVATSGSDGNDCLSPATACLTLNAAIAKSAPFDTILAATGVYTGTGAEVALLNKSADISGGWNSSFLAQDGLTVLDGQNARRGVTVNSSTNVRLDAFVIQNGFVNSAYGGGILNTGTLTVTNSAIENNVATGNVGYGGGVANIGGRLIIDRSSINHNTAAGRLGGGIMNDMFGQVLLINSTVSDNTAAGAGAIYNTNVGVVTIASSTIVHNYVTDVLNGGIANFYPHAVSVRNSIVAQNQNTDCIGVDSAGYNVLGPGCGAGASDITGTDPGLFQLGGQPRIYYLLAGSPAIDAGDPAGCTDPLGNVLGVDQRGVARFGPCDIGSFEFNPSAPYIHFAFLPLILHDYCSAFVDDFSNPLSGWPSSDTSSATYGYSHGQYHILSKVSGFFFLARSPACELQDYSVEVDAFWNGPTGSSYGLLFGVTAGFNEYYLFDINTDNKQFRLLRRNSGGGFATLVGATNAPSIAGGRLSNHLKVTRKGSAISLGINGTTLGSWSDTTITGLTKSGLVMSPYSNAPSADAHFDNFLLANLGSATNQAVRNRNIAAQPQIFSRDALPTVSTSIYNERK